MITSKQRAYLRGLANPVPALYQVGKEGIQTNLINTLRDALEARELIKIHALLTCPYEPRELCDKLCTALDAEGVQVIGRKIVLYKESRDNKQITLPRK